MFLPLKPPSRCEFNKVTSKSTIQWSIIEMVNGEKQLVTTAAPLRRVLSCSRTWPLSALDVSVLAALRSCRQHELQPGIRCREEMHLLFFSLESPQSSWISFCCLLRHSLITEGITFIFNELQSAGAALPSGASLTQHTGSHHWLPVTLYLSSRFPQINK